MKFIRHLLKPLDLQAKISLILIAVIVPTFLIVTIAENKVTQPILEEEIRQVGITSAKTLAAEIVSLRMFSLPRPTEALEKRIQEIIYSQPNIIRMDVITRESISGLTRIIASNVEEDLNNIHPTYPIPETATSEFKLDDETDQGYWDVLVPIEQRGRDLHAPRKILGAIHVQVSTQLVDRIVNAIWKTTASAAAFSVVLLILVLSYLLRKTISNDRLLREAENQNIQLTAQLQEAQRELMNSEKLAVMGQLTASFAHEIGTPLNAVGGHLQLLQEDLSFEQRKKPEIYERFEIIGSQLNKIEQIVKGFLQNTAKPTSQRQLTDVNLLVEKTLGIIQPRLKALCVEVRKKMDREMGPLRVVPLEIEQIFLNLLNNSLDSIKAKQESQVSGKMLLEVSTQIANFEGRVWAEIAVYDTGGGIRKSDLPNVLKPFYTTKRPGEGTGLGLTISQQLAKKYGGFLAIDSKEGSWTQVVLRLPFQGMG